MFRLIHIPFGALAVWFAVTAYLDTGNDYWIMYLFGIGACLIVIILIEMAGLLHSGGDGLGGGKQPPPPPVYQRPPHPRPRARRPSGAKTYPGDPTTPSTIRGERADIVIVDDPHATRDIYADVAKRLYTDDKAFEKARDKAKAAMYAKYYKGEDID